MYTDSLLLPVIKIKHSLHLMVLRLNTKPACTQAYLIHWTKSF